MHMHKSHINLNVSHSLTYNSLCAFPSQHLWVIVERLLLSPVPNFLRWSSHADLPRFLAKRIFAWVTAPAINVLSHSYLLEEPARSSTLHRGHSPRRSVKVVAPTPNVPRVLFNPHLFFHHWHHVDVLSMSFLVILLRSHFLTKARTNICLHCCHVGTSM